MKPSLLIATLVSCVAACGSNAAAPSPFNTLKVDVSIQPVARIFADTNGVDLLLDGGAPTHLNADFDTVTFAWLAPGKHVLELHDVASNCTLFQPNPDTIAALQDSTNTVSLGGICQ